jgi:hypothetical protein
LNFEIASGSSKDTWKKYDDEFEQNALQKVFGGQSVGSAAKKFADVGTSGKNLDSLVLWIQTAFNCERI